LKKAEDENRTIYYEKVPAPNDIPKPDPKNFVKMEDQTAMLSKAPELDAKMRHLVPPAVRQDLQELKNLLANDL
jgi:hypothetical protein